jgi:hypothetical protein
MNEGNHLGEHLGKHLDKHLSLDVLVDAYYGVGGDPAAARAHLAECESCTERWNDLARKRASATQPMEVSADFLTAQRHKIYERLEQPSAKRWRLWVPTAATAVLLTAAIFTFRPAPEARRPEIGSEIRLEMNDAQLFSDVYSLEQSYEPSAAAPIQALFEEQN